MACALLTALPACGQDFQTSLSSELWKASDICLTDSALDLRWRDDGSELAVMADFASMTVDYVPSPLDRLAASRTLQKSKTAGQLTWRGGLDDPLRFNFSLGGYDGFTDFRSLWLDEYYRQIFSGTPGYRKAEPNGFNIAAGGTWEYLPQSGMLNWNVGWQTDEVAPPYDKAIGQPLARGISHFETWRFGLGSEHVLAPVLRFKQDLTVQDTTARALRFGYKADALWAVTDTWSTRLGIEGSKESAFHSMAVSLAVEHDWSAQWFAGLQVRAYRDNGQIINPSLVSGAAPALDSLQAQLTLRYSGPKVSWHVGVGPYLARYSSLSTGSIWFSGLYRDRDWWCAQTACSIKL